MEISTSNGLGWLLRTAITSALLVMIGCGGNSGESNEEGNERELNAEYRFSISGTVDDVEIEFNTNDVFVEFDSDQFDLEDVNDDFEFETEGIVPMEVGTYVIGEDGFDAVDMENVFTQTNLHAYTGELEIISIQPLYQGTFRLTEFSDNHDGAVTRSGELVGYFSVPYEDIENGDIES